MNIGGSDGPPGTRSKYGPVVENHDQVGIADGSIGGGGEENVGQREECRPADGGHQVAVSERLALAGHPLYLHHDDAEQRQQHDAAEVERHHAEPDHGGVVPVEVGDRVC